MHTCVLYKLPMYIFGTVMTYVDGVMGTSVKFNTADHADEHFK